MDEEAAKRTVADLHSLAIEQHKKLTEIERQVRDLKTLAMALAAGGFVAAALALFR